MTSLTIIIIIIIIIIIAKYMDSTLSENLQLQLSLMHKK